MEEPETLWFMAMLFETSREKKMREEFLLSSSLEAGFQNGVRLWRGKPLF